MLIFLWSNYLKERMWKKDSTASTKSPLYINPVLSLSILVKTVISLMCLSVLIRRHMAVMASLLKAVFGLYWSNLLYMLTDIALFFVGIDGLKELLSLLYFAV